MKRLRFVVLAMWAGYAAALAGSVVIWVRNGSFDEFVGTFMGLYTIVGTGFAVHVTCRRHLPPRTRAAWRWIAASMAVLLASNIAFSREGLTFPNVGDWIRLLFAPLLLPGLLQLLPAPSSPLVRHKLHLDNAIVTAAGAMLLWYLVVGPALVTRGAPVAVTFAATAYPILDLALIFGATQVAFRPGPHSRQAPALLIAAGVLLLVVGDVYLGYERLNGPDRNWGGLQFACSLTAYFLLALAAVDQSRSAAMPEPTVPKLVARAAPWLPYVAVGAAYLLLLAVVLQHLPLYPYGGLMVCAVAMTGLVEARQLLASRENHLLATTDCLTGLANRSSLHQHLARALILADRSAAQVSVLLIDLNGFKFYNDTLGHEAGDEILVGFAHLLTHSARSSDLVARLGGDEFVVVLTTDNPKAAARAVASRITEATHEPLPVAGRMITLGASIGIADSRPAGCASELLHRADAAMYRTKRTARQV